jgi:hypothetical protein
LKDLVAVLRCASVAAQFTGVSPIGKTEPDAGVQITGTVPSTVSVAVGGLKVTATPPGAVASLIMSAGGAPTVGGVVSTTVILNELTELLVWASVAEQLTVVWPRGNTEPVAGAQLELVTASSGSVKLTK